MSRDRERFDHEIGKKMKLADAACCHEIMGMVAAGRRLHDHHVLGTAPAPAGVLNTITPCAACKLLRRRCAEECPFSPYFSPHEPQKFAAVHKVFGASNVSKMLMEVPESQRTDAANSLVYEANLRLRDPVYGCMGAIVTLQQQLQTLQAELNAVRAEILNYKFREAASTSSNNIININNNTIPAANSSLHSSLIISSAGTVSIAAHPPTPPPPPPPSIVVSSANSSSSASSLYTPPTSSAATVPYSSISSTDDHNVPYFD